MEEISFSRQVTARQLGQILGLVPVMIHWLRDGGPEAMALLVRDATSGDDTAVQTLLLRILDAFNFSGDLTINQVRELGEGVGAKVWAAALRKLVLDSDPPLIPAQVGIELLQHPGDKEATKQALDKLTRTHYYALAELCSLFKDSGDVEVAALVGSQILTHTGNDTDASPENIANVMRHLVTQCDVLFGRAAGAVGPSQRALGGTSSIVPAPVPSLPEPSVKDALLSARKHALRAFFQWKDESRAECVDELFSNHSFVEIARGIWERYDGLPGGWRGELEEMRDAGIAEAAWVPKDGKSLVSTQPEAGYNPHASSAASSVIPKQAHRRTIVRIVRGSKPNGTAETPVPPQFSTLHLLINEILDSEMFYYSVLKELQDVYVTRLREIASGSKGSEAQQQLGISLNDVESVFGWRLSQVIETSKNLLARLEVINLVRSEPKQEGGRAIFVASAFAAIAPSLSINYAPFVSGHRHAMHVLGGGAPSNRPQSVRNPIRPMSTRLTTVSARFSSKNLLNLAKELSYTSSAGPAGQNSFLGIWDSVAATSKRLKGQSLQSIMIMPIQRIPRYKLLLAELEKKLPADHPAVPKLTTALAQVSHVAQQINQALRQHEKLENLVGAGDMPEIAGAKNSTLNGFSRLTVNYKAVVNN